MCCSDPKCVEVWCVIVCGGVVCYSDPKCVEVWCVVVTQSVWRCGVL